MNYDQYDDFFGLERVNNSPGQADFLKLEHSANIFS